MLLGGNMGKMYNSAHFYLLGAAWEEVFTAGQLLFLAVFAVAFCFLGKLLFGLLCDRYGASRQIFIGSNLGTAGP